MSNANIRTLTKRRTQLLDELWELDKELTRLEAEEREIARALQPPRRRAKRACASCGRKSTSVLDGRCTRCRGIERSKRAQVAHPLPKSIYENSC